MNFFDMIFNDESFEWIEEHPNELINQTSFNSSESFGNYVFIIRFLYSNITIM